MGITAVSAAAVFRTPALLNLFARTGWVSMLATIALMIGSGMVARSIPYEKGFGAKQLAWVTHCAIMVFKTHFFVIWNDFQNVSIFSQGAVLAPISFVGGPILIRAAW